MLNKFTCSVCYRGHYHKQSQQIKLVRKPELAGLPPTLCRSVVCVKKNFSLALFSLLSSALGPRRENVLSKVFFFFFFCPPLTISTRPLIVRQGMLDNAEESLVAEARRSFFLLFPFFFLTHNFYPFSDAFTIFFFFFFDEFEFCPSYYCRTESCWICIFRFDLDFFLLVARSLFPQRSTNTSVSILRDT